MPTLQEWQRILHATAREKGWWPDECAAAAEKTVPTCIALIHSEVSEALESFRNHEPIVHYGPLLVSDPDPVAPADVFPVEGPIGGKVLLYRARPSAQHAKPEGLAIELADAISRILDLAEALHIDLDTALALKHEYNKTRPHRHGGKRA